MKSIILISLITLLLGINLFSQGVAINNDGTSADVSAMLDIKSTSSGVLIPRLTQAQRNAITSPASGLVIYQIDNNPGFYYNSGTPASPIWQRMAISGETVGGTGTATRIAFWDSSNSLSSNSNLYWDNTNNRLGLGTSSPSAQLHTTGSVRFAGAGTPGSGRVLTSDASGNATWQDGTAHSHATLSQGTGISTFSYNGTSSATISLTNTGVTAGTYGNSGGNIPNITVDAQGRLTAASDRSLTPGDIGAASASHTHATLSNGAGISSFSYNGSSAATIGVTFGNTAGTVAEGNHTHSGMVTGSGTTNYNAYWTSANTIGFEQYISISRGGTGIGSTPTNGQLLIGNGTGYSLGTLTAGTGINITNGSGTITISGTGGTVTSISAGIPGAQTGTSGLTFSTNPITSTGSIALSNTGVTAGSYGNSGGNIPNITVDAQGRLTAASNRTLTPGDIGAASASHTHSALNFNDSGTGAASGSSYNGSSSLTISYNTIGAIGGSGAATRVAFWNGTNTLSSNANLYWDNTNSRLGIGTATPSYSIHTTGDVYANGGWFRVSGDQGLYFQTWGGGFYMTDATWIRTYGNKSFYHNTGTMRTDGTLQVGSSGSTMNVPNGGDFAYRTNVLFANTSGNVGVGTNAPTQRLHVAGNARVEGAYFDSSNSAGTSGQVLTSTGTGTQWNKALTVQSASATVTAGNWYRIASNSGNRADATFTLRDLISGGGHSTVRFHAGVNFGDAGGISFTLISNSQYATPTFTKVRIIRNSTYDGAYLEVYCARSGNVSYDIFDNFQSSGWTPQNWTAGSIPSGWTAHEYELNRLFAVGGSDDILSLTRTGFFGVGVENPTVRLDVSGQTRIVNSTSPTLYIQNDANSFANHALMVNSQGTNRAFIGSNGGAYFAQNVGIGNNNPGQMLDVNGRIRIVSSMTELYQSGNRLLIRSEDVDNVAQFASYGLYLPRTGQTYNLYLAGSLKVGHSESGVIDINDTNTRLQKGSGNAVRIQTNSGYVDVGPQNTGWSHFSTDRPRFYFNKGITVDEGLIGSYDENLSLQTSGTTRITVLNSNGNVGIGTTAPAYSLDLANGTFGFGNSNVRTETRNDAGLQGNAGAQSGFFEANAPAPVANWPTGASSWWHLLDIRHSNNTNNYAMQFAGSFFDQKVYVRKTNNDPAQPWNQIVTIPTGTNQGTNSAWALMGDFAFSPDDIGGASVLSGDDVTADYAMPFSIVIDGTSYSTITISSNGWISFSNPGYSNLSNTALPTSFFSAPTIFPYWDDLVTEGSHIRYFSTGTAPNRAVVVDFECRTYTDSYSVRFQVTIHEGSGLINVQYRDPMAPQANGQFATIGFQLAGGASAKAYPIIYNGKILDDNRDNSMGWSIAPVR